MRVRYLPLGGGQHINTRFIPSAILLILPFIGGVGAAPIGLRRQAEEPATASPAALNILHSFEDRSTPGTLIRGVDGNFYGVGSRWSTSSPGLQLVFRLTPSGVLTVLHRFQEGADMWSLVQGADENLYGTTTRDGATGTGTVFKLSLAGELETLYDFQGGADGEAPRELIAGSDGHLYGLSDWGAQEHGTLFKITTSGVFTTLHAFTSSETGHTPNRLIEGRDGNLYLLSYFGGAGGNYGSLLRSTRTGNVTTLYNFPGGAGGSSPIYLVHGSDGHFYVAHTAPTGQFGTSVLSRITEAGVRTEVHRFAGAYSSVQLVAAGDGSIIYGTASSAGSSFKGSVFQFTAAAGVTTLYSFSGTEGSNPRSPIVGSDGSVHGTASGIAGGPGIVFRVSSAGALTTVFDFGAGLEGFTPAGLAQGSDGVFYGTTLYGGPASKGTVYRMTADGQVTTLYAFEQEADGALPARIIQGSDGNLYGVTSQVDQKPPTLFRLTPSGSYTTLDTSPPTTNYNTTYKLVKGRDGSVYGTVSNGGANGLGAVFRINEAGVLGTIYSFTGGSNASFPDSLVHATDGNLYGITSRGGQYDFGTAFRLTLSGDLTVIKSYPFGIFSPRTPNTLVQGTDGNLYGTHRLEALPHSQYVPGTLFRMTLNGDATTIYTFPTGNGFGIGSVDPSILIAGSNGKLYGATSGPSHIFSSTLSGSVTTLYVFNSQSEGSGSSGLLQGSDGNLYGPLSSRGPAGGGTVFQLVLNLLPRPVNLSTRLNVLNNDNVLIGGFIITGNDPKKVMIRGIGPSLAQFFSGSLADPTLDLYQGGTLLTSNDNWKSDQRAEIEATGIAPTNDLESAIVRTLTPGNYTAILRGKGNTTGIGLVEAYDLDRAADSKLANISTRGFVDTGDNVMIGGLIVTGPPGGGIATVIVRAIGPTLSNVGISGALQDPTLDLVNSDGVVIRSNNNWRDSQQAEIEAAGLQPGDDREAALKATIPPGNYTAIVRGNGNTTGVGLVEVYHLQ